MPPNLLWHYTFSGRDHLDEILGTRILKVTQRIEGVDRPLLMFSSNQRYEKTAGFGFEHAGALFDLSLANTPYNFANRDQITLARVGVEPSNTLIAWRDFCRTGEIPKESARALEKVARKVGANPSDWFVRFEEVPSPEWKAVDAWNGAEWSGCPGL